jgi:hypothetical protein
VNWKHHLITAFLAFMAGGATVWFVGNLGQKADDPVLIAQIAELKDEVESERAASNTSYQEANDARESMLDTEIELAATQEELDAMRRRKNETPLQIVEERDALRVQNDKLVLNNGLLKIEVQGLRVSRVHLVAALDTSESRNVLTDKRYAALKRSKKSAKRKRIIQQVFTHTGTFVVAWAGGKYSQ